MLTVLSVFVVLRISALHYNRKKDLISSSHNDLSDSPSMTIQMSQIKSLQPIISLAKTLCEFCE